MKKEYAGTSEFWSKNRGRILYFVPLIVTMIVWADQSFDWQILPKTFEAIKDYLLAPIADFFIVDQC